MGSGYFPLSKCTENARKLFESLDWLKKECDGILDSALRGEDGQYDNSVWDGYAVGQVLTGIDLIMKNFS